MGDFHHDVVLQQLCDVILLTWTKISEECLQKLVESEPCKMKSALKTKAAPTCHYQGVPNEVAV